MTPNDRLGQGYPLLSALPSARLADEGAYANGGSDGIVWWLRTPGNDQLHAAQVKSDGSVFLPGSRVDDASLAVRPALILA